MIVSIMQPYFFPYIGYFQLIAQSDIFVFHDDVQYINGGWVNRNRILDGKGDTVWITRPVKAAGHRLAIDARSYMSDARSTRHVLGQVENTYSRAPHFDDVWPLVCDLMQFPDPNVAAFNIHLLRSIAVRLGLRARFMRSSELPNAGMKGQDRVIDICNALGATRYINPIGGRALYQDEAFYHRGVELGFLEPTIERRPGVFPYLSIIHTLMTEGDAAISELLGRFQIVRGYPV